LLNLFENKPLSSKQFAITKLNWNVYHLKEFLPSFVFAGDAKDYL
jgi:hypothetical protein